MIGSGQKENRGVPFFGRNAAVVGRSSGSGHRLESLTDDLLGRQLPDVDRRYPAARLLRLQPEGDEGVHRFCHRIRGRHLDRMRRRAWRDLHRGRPVDPIEPIAQLPRTPSGKVDPAALPAPSPRRTDGLAGGARTATEQALAPLWAQVLRVDQVGVDDDFFELGGDSLAATRLWLGIGIKAGLFAAEDRVRVTRIKVIEAAAKFNLTIHDHIVVGRADHASFRALGPL